MTANPYRAAHGWPGKVAVVEKAVDLVLEQIAMLQTDAACKPGGS